MNKTNFMFLITIVALLVMANCMHRCDRQKLSDSEHNLKVMQDSIQTLQLKNGDMLATINSYILDKKELENYLDISKAEIKELEKKVGKVAYVSNIKTEIKYDSVFVTDTIKRFVVNPQDTLIKFNGGYNSEWLSFDYETIIKNKTSNSTFSNITIPAPLRVGLSDDYRIWVVSKNPYLNINDIEGAVVSGSSLNKKQKKFSVGVHAGFGAGYNIIKKDISVGPYVGVGLNYNLINF